MHRDYNLNLYSESIVGIIVADKVCVRQYSQYAGYDLGQTPIHDGRIVSSGIHFLNEILNVKTSDKYDNGMSRNRLYPCRQREQGTRPHTLCSQNIVPPKQVQFGVIL